MGRVFLERCYVLLEALNFALDKHHRTKRDVLATYLFPECCRGRLLFYSARYVLTWREFICSPPSTFRLTALYNNLFCLPYKTRVKKMFKVILKFGSSLFSLLMGLKNRSTSPHNKIILFSALLPRELNSRN